MGFWSDIYHTWIRRTREILRQPAWVVNILVQPLIWLLLFTQLFQKIANIPQFPGVNYIDYFAPGIIVMLAIFGSMGSGFGWLYDINFNLIEKELVSPVNRFALIIGNTLGWFLNLTLEILILLGISLLLGVPIISGVTGVFMCIIIVGLLGIGFSCFGDALVLATHSQAPLVSLNTLISMPLMFLSSVMVPIAFLPSWISYITLFNPVEYAVKAVRPLFLSGFDLPQFGLSFAILFIFASLGIIVATHTLKNYKK